MASKMALHLGLQLGLVREITQWVDDNLGLSPGLQGRILGTVATLFLLWVIRRLTLRYIIRQNRGDARLIYSWRKGLTYSSAMLGLLIIARIWIEGFSSITTYFGLISAGLVVALQTPITNFAAWIFLIWRKPFEVGDRIQMGEHRGDVIDISLFQFRIIEIGNWVDADQSTGRIIHIPNGKIFTEPQANYTKGFSHIWVELPVLVTFESNWRKAKELLQAVVDEHAEHFSEAAEESIRLASEKFMIFYTKLTPIVYTSVKDSGVLLTMRFLVDARRRRGTEQAMWEGILEAFAQHPDIDLAYPTTRLYNNMYEGKEDARAAPPQYEGVRLSVPPGKEEPDEGHDLKVIAPKEEEEDSNG